MRSAKCYNKDLSTVLGKLSTEALSCRAVTSRIFHISAVFLKSIRERENKTIEKNKMLLDFVLAHAQRDQRPYIRVNILDKTILGLLDSGASNTITNQFGLECLQAVGLNMKQSLSAKCVVANGSSLFLGINF